jgi:hypothetical protein
MTILSRWKALCAAVVSLGCSGATEDVAVGDETVVSWEAFLTVASRHTRQVDGETVYLVEWDIPIREAELHAYYLRTFVETEKSTVEVKSNGADNVWSTEDKQLLTYCVSNSFGEDQSRIISEMTRATWAWQRTGNVRFLYLPSHNASCNDANAAVTFPVVPVFDGGACAFFPDQDGQGHCTSEGRALVIDVADIDSWPSQQIFGEVYPNVTTEGTLRHELGHILGMRHEHIREANNAVDYCAQLPSEVLTPGPYRALTPYDVASAMHYPWCDGLLDATQDVTALDGQGLTRLYGAAPWISVVL